MLNIHNTLISFKAGQVINAKDLTCSKHVNGIKILKTFWLTRVLDKRKIEKPPRKLVSLSTFRLSKTRVRKGR